MAGSKRQLADGSIEYTLAVPLQLGTERVERLTFRKMNTGDMRRMPAGSEKDYTMGVFLDLAGELAAVPPSTIDALDPVDGLEVFAIAAGFFGASLPTAAFASGSSRPASPGSLPSSTG